MTIYETTTEPETPTPKRRRHRRRDDLWDTLGPPPPLPKRRFPVKPLLDHYGGDTGVLAKAANVSRRQVQRWCKTGLTFITADEVCTECDLWPPHVWLDWDDDDPPEADAA